MCRSSSQNTNSRGSVQPCQIYVVNAVLFPVLRVASGLKRLACWQKRARRYAWSRATWQARRGGLRHIGGAAWRWPAIFADPDAVAPSLPRVGSRWPAVDGLVNNAGIAPMATVNDTTRPRSGTNLRYQCARALSAVPRTEPAAARGQLAVGGQRLVDPCGESHSRGWRRTTRPRPPSTNSPGRWRWNGRPRSASTPSCRRWSIPRFTPLRGMTSEQVQEMAGFHPLGRIGQPEDVASLILFLLSGGFFLDDRYRYTDRWRGDGHLKNSQF